MVAAALACGPPRPIAPSQDRKQASVETVPVIDIARSSPGRRRASRPSAAKIAHACEEIGFFQITGHGVPEEFIQRVYDVSTRSSISPRTRRPRPASRRPTRCAAGRRSARRGLSYSLENAAPGDLKEKMDMGPPDVDRSDPYFTGPAAGPHFAAERVARRRCPRCSRCGRSTSPRWPRCRVS